MWEQIQVHLGKQGPIVKMFVQTDGSSTLKRNLMQILRNIHIHIHIQRLFCIPVTAVCKWFVRIYMYPPVGSKFAP